MFFQNKIRRILKYLIIFFIHLDQCTGTYVTKLINFQKPNSAKTSFFVLLRNASYFFYKLQYPITTDFQETLVVFHLKHLYHCLKSTLKSFHFIKKYEKLWQTWQTICCFQTTFSYCIC